MARSRAVAFFRFAVVIVLGTFNIWIFARVGGALKDIWFPTPPAAAAPAPIDGSCRQTDARVSPEQVGRQELQAAPVRQRGAGAWYDARAQQLKPCIAPGYTCTSAGLPAIAARTLSTAASGMWSSRSA